MNLTDKQIKRREYYYANRERTRSLGRAYYLAKKGKILAYAKLYRQENVGKVKAYKTAYNKANSEKNTANSRRYVEASPEKLKAQRAVHKAIKAGELVRLPCEICGENKRIDAHHPDYARPLDVIWLCRLHHGELHANERQTKGVLE